ncbi:Tripartite tricarboxylate transporter TctA protein [Halorhabdus tiamatea SARL4B]|uniref:Tripartite tricarboxylate transporter TctA family n=1 Tax=Halorhabdus tiamatea SARL4B TaxID=1033806 RepID=F7PI88_9EURY|nr:tripartite tricarboxylate transporter permease [Halorhabdus tiamatea]ERJ05263.1 Tripartite tricarboxylate transporter TctA protein [Halorhabdus tiamatea SARL4B]CCQ32166.1 tripartite tricarboxylate transporter TctA family [Halorhabdus tiamatea SARL4B]
MFDLGVRLAIAPEATALAIVAIAAGICLGTISGLTPGLHANNFALLLAAVAPSVPAPPRLVGAAMLAAGVVHTFLDFVPALALGVPDPAMAASALPSHRLVLGGRGREALRLSALGSGLAVVFALPLVVPVTLVMLEVYPVLAERLPVVLTAIAAAVIATEPTNHARKAALLSFLASAALGVVTLDVPAEGVLPVGSMLAPLFGGLFGAPVLIDAMRGSGVPSQDDPTVRTTRTSVGGLALLGTVSGAIVGYLPGVSSAIAATLALVSAPSQYGSRGFVVTTSGVNTSNTLFALCALIAFGNPRTGVLVALDQSGAPLAWPLLVAAVLIAAAVGFVLVVVVGDWYLRLVRKLDHTRLSVVVLGVLAVLSGLFAGPIGVAVFAVSTLVGLIPARLGARRVSLMGVLIGPLILGV